MARPISSQQLLDAALHCAADRHWEAVRLADVAAALDVSLTEIRAHVTDKEALVDLFWDRADAALLAKSDDPVLRAAEIPARIEQLVFAWLEPLAPHRRTAHEMLLVRLEPGHLHIQLPTLLRVSKTVQWLREAAGLRATFAWRALEESALTALFVATVIAWLRDGERPARDIVHTGLRAGNAIRSRVGPRNDPP